MLKNRHKTPKNPKVPLKIAKCTNFTTGLKHCNLKAFVNDEKSTQNSKYR